MENRIFYEVPISKISDNKIDLSGMILNRHTTNKGQTLLKFEMKGIEQSGIDAILKWDPVQCRIGGFACSLIFAPNFIREESNVESFDGINIDQYKKLDKSAFPLEFPPDFIYFKLATKIPIDAEPSVFSVIKSLWADPQLTPKDSNEGAVKGSLNGRLEVLFSDQGLSYSYGGFKMIGNDWD